MTTALQPYGDRFVARRAFFKIFGAAFRIYGPEGNLKFYVRQRAFRLREQITVYANETRKQALLGIQARQMLDVSATFDVIDLATGETVGALKRRGLRSILRDQWSILGPDDAEIGSVREDSKVLAFVRRFLFHLVPQAFVVTLHGRQAGTIRQRFNPFVLTYDVELSQGPGAIDPRLGVALTVLLLAIEGRQD
ncbi:MAG: hypothetical protein JXB39_12045 [Deltaproteobacteria bacterium]|nr:hypothetical protein [Deltaproteobacteria bacterium]